MSDRFAYVKKGYDPEEVDQYIETLETVIRSYKEKDSAIKNAIINAQIAADNIIKSSEENAWEIKNNTVKQLANINNSIDTQKRLVKEFQVDYNSLVDKYVHQFNQTEILKVYDKINELEEYIAKLQNSDVLKNSSDS